MMCTLILGLKQKADFPETGGVLVFRIPIETLDSMKVVDMLNTDFSCDLEAWTNIVQFYRYSVQWVWKLIIMNLSIWEALECRMILQSHLLSEAKK